MFSNTDRVEVSPALTLLAGAMLGRGAVVWSAWRGRSSNGRNLPRLVVATLVVLLLAALAAGTAEPVLTAVEIGMDEHYEVIKGLLWAKGFSLYHQVWNDQPPLYTVLLGLCFKSFGATIAVARLLAVAFGLSLLAACGVLTGRRCALAGFLPRSVSRGPAGVRVERVFYAGSTGHRHGALGALADSSVAGEAAVALAGVVWRAVGGGTANQTDGGSRGASAGGGDPPWGGRINQGEPCARSSAGPGDLGRQCGWRVPWAGCGAWNCSARRALGFPFLSADTGARGRIARLALLVAPVVRARRGSMGGGRRLAHTGLAAGLAAASVPIGVALHSGAHTRPPPSVVALLLPAFRSASGVAEWLWDRGAVRARLGQGRRLDLEGAISGVWVFGGGYVAAGAGDGVRR